MIPKKIHYCWFGGKPLPHIYRRCIDTWRSNLPGFEIIRWDESNTDINTPFLQKSLKSKQWAFVSDYIRMRVLYEHGGIYLDCDIELIRDISPLLNDECFFGNEAKGRPNSSVIGCTKEHSLPERCMRIIDDRHKRKQPYLIAPEVLLQALSTQPNTEKTTIYPEDYFYPYNPHDKLRPSETLMFSDITKNTFAIHHWGKSWNQNIFSRALKKLERSLRRDKIES